MAEEIEGKGFVIKDRRAFSEEGELKEEAKAEEKTARAGEQAGAEKRAERAGSTDRGPLPAVNFNSLILSLSSSALMNMGEIADPQTGQKVRDLPLAKHSIDTIAMLKDKTRGNLDEEEQKFLDSILADLRWRFVKLKG